MANNIIGIDISGTKISVVIAESNVGDLGAVSLVVSGV